MEAKLEGLMRSHHCGELSKDDVGKSVTLCGWVNKYRDLGALHFIDIRDKFGLTQLGFENFKTDLKELKNFSLESVIKISGTVCERPRNAINKKMDTGEVEVQVEYAELLSRCDIDNIPFLPFGAIESTEDLRLKYRYLDIRTKKLQDILSLRSKASFEVRSLLMGEGFTEVETPVLYKSTPEGARDYVVPSRVHAGKVYALPQSPQTLKQLLMIGGTDRYFQITKCFRDEDLRADRQPEFTQIDIEASYVSADSIRDLSQKLLIKLFGLDSSFKLPMMSFSESMTRYGSDKPDLRFELEHITVTDLFVDSGFGTFSTVAKSEGLIKSIFVPISLGTLPRKEIDKLSDVVKPYGGRGVAWFKVSDNERTGGISKFIDDKNYDEITQRAEQSGDGLWLFFADEDSGVVHACADAVRRHLAHHLNLIEEGYRFVWVYDFPLLEWSEEDKRFAARHHPFTMPKIDDLEMFKNSEKLGEIRAEAYDVVCNGYEIGGGSMRIYDTNIQSQMFKVLGMSDEEAKYQFGFFMDALKYGTPPHGGVAFGFDRIVMLLAKTSNIRDVIAFPKTASATDIMAGSPSIPSEGQLKELHIGSDFIKQ